MINYIVTSILLMMNRSMAVTVYNPYFHFPSGSDAFMGLIVTVAVPVEAGTPGEVLLSTILEGNYLIPNNQTEFEYPPIYPAEEERTFLYEIFQKKIEEFGLSGKNCLLRAVCETAHFTTLNTGVLGDIVHILLTPTSSKIEIKLDEYTNAEKRGKNLGCRKYEKKCPFSILNTISTFEKIVDLNGTNKLSKKIVKLF